MPIHSCLNSALFSYNGQETAELGSQFNDSSNDFQVRFRHESLFSHYRYA
jgi:hypothetical protein